MREEEEQRRRAENRPARCARRGASGAQPAEPDQEGGGSGGVFRTDREGGGKAEEERSAASTGTARNDGPGAFAAYSLPAQSGGRARGSSHTNALSFTYPQCWYTGPVSRKPPARASRTPMAYVPCSAIARAM